MKAGLNGKCAFPLTTGVPGHQRKQDWKFKRSKHIAKIGDTDHFQFIAESKNPQTSHLQFINAYKGREHCTLPALRPAASTEVSVPSPSALPVGAVPTGLGALEDRSRVKMTYGVFAGCLNAKLSWLFWATNVQLGSKSTVRIGRKLLVRGGVFLYHKGTEDV